MHFIEHEKLTLSNGLEVILHEDHALPTVAVNIWYHVGSKDEEKGRTGFAHLFEHVMFEGSKHYNQLYFEPLQKVGANLNGSTTSDRTNYWETLPSNYLELALWLESDRMGFLLDALDQKRFDIQRDVVKNERRQSYENQPYGLAPMLLQPAVFPDPHPYSWNTIGSQEDLDAANLDDIKDFFRQYYAPSNASLTIAGDFENTEIKRLIECYFGNIPPGPSINRVDHMESTLRGEVRLAMRDKVQLPRLYLVWPSCAMFDKDEAPLDVLGTALGDGKSSRLYRNLVYEKQIARDVSVGHYGQEIAGEFYVQVTANPGHSLEEIQDVVEAELERVRREPLPDHELIRAKNRIESHYIRLLERSGGFGGRADQLNYYNVFAGNPDVINSDIERYMEVDGEDVARVATSVLGGNRVRLAVLSEKATCSSTSNIDRSVMPSGSIPRTYDPPVPRRDCLPNGMNVLYIEKHEFPIVGLGLLLRAGATTDPDDRPGLAHMTATLLPEGTNTRSSQQIAEEMEFLGAHLDSESNREYVLLSAGMLTSHWDTVFEIVSDTAKNATFPANEFERVRNEQLTDLRRIVDDPTSIAQRAAHALVYGPETKYGHPLMGTLGSINDLTREEVITHFSKHYGPSDATLIVVGDVTADEVMSKAEMYMGDWSQHGLRTLDESTAGGSPVRPTTIYLVDKPGAVQSIIRTGQLTVPRSDPDYYALSILNYLFGAQPTARLFMNLRQDKGYSYGYYSGIDWSIGPSAFFAGGAVQTAVTKESVVETLKEFEDIRGGRPVSESEFKSARDGIIRGFPAQFETQSQLLNQLTNVEIFGLPDNYYSNLIANLQTVSLEDIHRVAETRVDKNQIVLVVGDREIVEPELMELGLPIVAIDYDGHQISGVS